jgi:Abnormal spindle-like microcephaly-assoc'd, ASPM-SPD-2-Hydin/Transmembrane protein 131-like N-terminal
MKSLRNNRGFNGAWMYAAYQRSNGKSAIPFALLIFAVFAILSISGCTGVASSPNAGSSQNSPSIAAGVSVAPASISFGDVPIGSTSSQSVTIMNNGGSTLTVTQVSTSAPGIKISDISLPLTIAAGNQSNFNLVFSPKTPGVLSGNVSVSIGGSSFASTVSLSGIGMSPSAFLATSASSLNFGNVAIGKSKQMTVTLTNAGNSKVTLSNVSISGAHYSTSGVSDGLILAPGQSATLDAMFKPSALGKLSGKVTVASNAKNSPATISLSGDGAQSVAPSVVLAWHPSVSLVTGYHVYRSESSDGPFEKLNNGIVSADSYTDSNVLPGVTYYYMVKSVGHGGDESVDSAQASASIPAS